MVSNILYRLEPSNTNEIITKVTFLFLPLRRLKVQILLIFLSYWPIPLISSELIGISQSLEQGIGGIGQIEIRTFSSLSGILMKIRMLLHKLFHPIVKPLT